jgi:hypothetical protein
MTAFLPKCREGTEGEGSMLGERTRQKNKNVEEMNMRIELKNIVHARKFHADRMCSWFVSCDTEVCGLKKLIYIRLLKYRRAELQLSQQLCVNCTVNNDKVTPVWMSNGKLNSFNKK